MSKNPASQSPKIKTIKEKIAEARTEVAERISVVGVKEALQEEVIWIRRIFQILLLPLTCLSIYFTWVVIEWWLRSGYTDAIKDFVDEESLPVSNVTVCAQVYFNKTFIRENVTVPPSLIANYTKETGATVDEFYNQLTLFLSLIMRDRKFSPFQITYFKKVVQQNKRIADYSAFVESSVPTCESMLKKCWFNGIKFDCCKRAVQSIDEDGICYLLALSYVKCLVLFCGFSRIECSEGLNFNSDNAFPLANTVKQTKPSPAGGLTLDAQLELKDFPWFEADADDGFKIYVNAVPYTSGQSPQTSPNGAETFVKVKAAKRLMSTNCALRNQLVLKNDFGLYYDPEGFGCVYKELFLLSQKYMPCRFPVFMYRPNVSLVCSPSEIYIILNAFSSQDTNAAFKQLVGTFADTAQGKKYVQNLEDDWKNSLTDRTRCPRHCQYWEYSSTSSFIYLEKDETKKDTTMFSRIHVYYADFSYRQYEQVKEVTIYLAFCKFGNVVGLYLGMSIVSFFHVFYYVPRYWLVLFKFRKGRGIVTDIPLVTVTIPPRD